MFAPNPMNERGHVLVVDDKEDVLTAIRLLLKDDVDSLHTTKNPATIPALIGENDYDVILLDWQMPIMGGIDFLKALRGYNGGDRPRIVYCTTERDIGQIAMARKAGADDHMLKPFDQQMLEAKFQPFA